MKDRYFSVEVKPTIDVAALKVAFADAEVLFATAVNCWAKINKAIYVDARGYLYPCGWLGKPIVWENTCKTMHTSYSFNNTADNNPIKI